MEAEIGVVKLHTTVCHGLPAASETRFSSVKSLSRVWLFATPWIAARQASLSTTNSQSSPKLMSIELAMPSSHLILCSPLLLPPIPPSIRVFSNESTLCMRWPKYWSFSFSIIPSKEHPGLISFRMGSYLSIITLNIKGLNAPIKRERVAEWIQKWDPYTCCLQETHLKIRDTYRLKLKGWKKIFHTNRYQKKAGVAILVSDKIDFKTNAVKRDKEGHKDQRINPRRRYNDYKYICTQHRSTAICKANANKYERGNKL